VAVILEQAAEAGVQLSIRGRVIEVAVGDAVDEREVCRRVLLRGGLPGQAVSEGEGAAEEADGGDVGTLQ